MRDSVGQGGRNLVEDVRAVQQALNRRATALGIGRLSDDGRCTARVIQAIRRFELFVLGARDPLGRIEPGSAAGRALHAQGMNAIASQQARARAAVAQLSGRAWWDTHRDELPSGDELGEIDPCFALRLRDFIRALRRAGASVVLRGGRVDARRAHVLHWAWQVAEATTAPRNVPNHPDIAILWDHGEDPQSRFAAREMLLAAGVDRMPARESAAIDGEAVELEIDWGGAISVADSHGRMHLLDRPRRTARNPVLRQVAASYGLRQDRTQPMRFVPRNVRRTADSEALAL